MATGLRGVVRTARTLAADPAFPPLRRQLRATLILEVEAGIAASSAEEQVLLGVEYGDLGGALDRLSPELRAVVEATVLDGLTTREASRLLHIPTRHRENQDDASPRTVERGVDMTTWHLDAGLVSDYLDGSTSRVQAAQPPFSLDLGPLSCRRQSQPVLPGCCRRWH
jgi:hypothetical protein